MKLALLAALLWLAGAGLARLIGRRPADRLDRLELILLAGPLGAYLACWLLLCGQSLGVLKLSAGLARWGVGLLAVGLSGWWVGTLRGARAPLGLRRAWAELPGWARLLLGLLAAFAFGQLAQSVVVTLGDWDARMYRLPYSGVVWRSGELPGFASPSCNDCFSYPPLPMLLYALGWAWLDQVDLLWPKLLNPLFGLISLGWVYLLMGRGLAASRGLALLAALLAAVYAPVRWAAEGTDWMLTCWSLAALYFALRREAASWVWAGICSGLAILTKHHGLISLVCLAPAMLALPGGAWRRLGRSAAAGALALAIAAPWLLRNQALFDNPLYPAVIPLLGGAFHDEWVHRNVWSYWQQPHVGYRMFYAAFCFLRIGLLLPLVGAPLVLRALPQRPRAAALWLYLAVGLALFVLLGVTPQGGGLRLFAAAWICALCLLCVLIELLDSAARPRLLLPVLIAALLLTQLVLARDVFMALRDSSQMHRLWDRVDAHEPGTAEVVTHFFWPALLLLLWAARRRLIGRGGRLAALGRPGAALAAVLLLVGWPQLVADPLDGALRLARGEAADVDWVRSAPWEPYGRWIERNLPDDAVLLTFNSQRWIIPRTLLSADSPLLERAYMPDATEREVLELLARLGVSHVIENDHYQPSHPLDGQGLLWSMVAQRRWFREVYSAPAPNCPRTLRIYEVLYPPELEQLRASAIPRPWLYERATMGPLAP